MFESKDLKDFLKGESKRLFNNQEEAKKVADSETEATFLRWLSRYDDSYMLYSYKAEDKEYFFLWESYWDEYHRARSPNGEKVWYDDFPEGSKFKIKYLKSDPRVHYVVGDIPNFSDSAFFWGII